MKTNDNTDILLIEDYLDDKLSQGEKLKLEERLENESELARLYRFRLKIRNDLAQAQKYKSTRNEVIRAMHRTRINRKRNLIYGIAASLITFAVISGALFLDSGRHHSQTAQSEMEPTGKNQPETQMNQPQQYGSAGEYNPASRILDHVVKNDSVILSWQETNITEQKIIISTMHTGEVIFKHNIPQNSKSLSLPRNLFPADTVIWFLTGTEWKDTIVFE